MGEFRGLDEAPESGEKVISLEEAGEHKKRRPFAVWTVGDKEYKLKLKAAVTCRIEDRLGKNILSMVDNIPSLQEMLTVIQGAMDPWNHGISFSDIQKLYDQWVDEGGSHMELFTKVVLPVLVVSGFLPEKEGTALLEELERE